MGEKDGIKTLKVGIWKKTSESKSGFVILEALVCLAILAILLPLTYRTVLQARKHYHLILLKERASQIANFELSKLETQVLKKYSVIEEIEPKHEFNLDHEIKEEAAGLKKISVFVNWQTLQGPQSYFIEGYVFSDEKSKEKLG